MIDKLGDNFQNCGGKEQCIYQMCMSGTQVLATIAELHVTIDTTGYIYHPI